MNIRKKGKWKTGETKLVIEEHGKYLETIPPVKELIEILRPEKASREARVKENKIEENVSKGSLNQVLREPPIKDGKGILIPSAKEEWNKDSVVWSCDRCNFKTALIFEDKHCPNCNRKEPTEEEVAKSLKEINDQTP